MSLSYADEKFSNARRMLMLPHSQGEAASIADAFHECRFGIHDIDRKKLRRSCDENTQRWLAELETLMDTTGLTDPHDVGLLLVKARLLIESQRYDVSRLIDELASAFNREFWSNT